MSTDKLLRSHKRFLFGTKGLTKNDVIKIDSIFKTYEIDIVYKVDEFKSNDVQSIIELCEQTSATSLHANNPMNVKNPYVSLLINGPLSSWEIFYPKEGTVKDRAAVTQLFSEVKDVLIVRQEFFPRPPWNALRDVVVFIPIFFLSAKIIFPNLHYDYSQILRVTVFAAVFNYLIAFIEVRRYFRRAIVVNPSSRDRLRTAGNWILVTIAASLITTASEKALELIAKHFSQ